MINEDAIKNSFQKVKEHILRLEGQIIQNKGNLAELKDSIDSLTNAIIKGKSTNSSTGNQGVNQSNNQSINQTIEQTSIQSIDQIHKKPSSDLINLERNLLTLTKQEFRIFLTVYEAEEQGKVVNYELLSTKLGLTSSCLRGYLSSIIKKGAPILKKKHKNNSITLTIERGFKSLTSTQKLIDLYYRAIDSSQTRLTEE